MSSKKSKMSTEKPKTSTEKPKTSTAKPTTSTGKPKTLIAKPRMSAEKPRMSAEKPKNLWDVVPKRRKLDATSTSTFENLADSDESSTDDDDEPTFYQPSRFVMAHCKESSDPLTAVQFNPFLKFI
jgi:hypothetical protein